MGENSAIEWTHHTFNPWWGCTKVSPGCDHCYAETFSKRVGQKVWGPGAPRRTFGDKHWNEPLKWNAAAQNAATRARVFCASMADWTDDEAPAGAVERLWKLIRATPALDWLLLTKRAPNIRKRLPADWGEGWPNVWLGVTVENQDQARARIPWLLDVPARVRFLSCEPLLGPVDLRRIVLRPGDGKNDPRVELDALSGHLAGPDDVGPKIDWVIVGGESGPGARPMHPAWARSLRDQCTAAGVPFHFKQWGEFAPWLDETRFTHGGAEKREHVWLAENGDTGECWVYDDDGSWSNWTGNPPTNAKGDADVVVLHRAGKKVAGRELDGRTWDGFPEVRHAD